MSWLLFKVQVRYIYNYVYTFLNIYEVYLYVYVDFVSVKLTGHNLKIPSGSNVL
jgi:hypothetical protein